MTTWIVGLVGGLLATLALWWGRSQRRGKLVAQERERVAQVELVEHKRIDVKVEEAVERSEAVREDLADEKEKIDRADLGDLVSMVDDLP